MGKFLIEKDNKNFILYKAFSGNTKIKKIFYGSNLLWEADDVYYFRMHFRDLSDYLNGVGQLVFYRNTKTDSETGVTSVINPSLNFEYRINRGAWTTPTFYDGSTEDILALSGDCVITIHSYDVMEIRGSNSGSIKLSGGILFNCPCDLSGHITTLLSKDDSVLGWDASEMFYYFFKGPIRTVTEDIFNMTSAGSESFKTAICSSGLSVSYYKSDGTKLFDGCRYENNKLTLNLKLTEINEALFYWSFYPVKTVEYILSNARIIHRKLYGLSLVDSNITKYIVRFMRTDITQLDALYIEYGSGSGPQYEIHFEYSTNASPAFDLSNIVTQGSGGNKGTTRSYDIYTDCIAIKDAVISKRDEYTIVHVYYKNGTVWDV